MLGRRGPIVLRRSGWILTGAWRSLAMRPPDQNPLLEERMRKMREDAKARFARQKLDVAQKDEKIDGKKYVDWGKNKFKLPLRDSAGLMLTKAAQERIQNARIAKKKLEEAAKSKTSKSKVGKKTRKVKSSEEEVKKKKRNAREDVTKAKSKGTELIDAALKSLRSLESEVDDEPILPALATADLPPPKVKIVHSDKAERGTNDEDELVSRESESGAAEDELPESTSILKSLMESEDSEENTIWEDDEDLAQANSADQAQEDDEPATKELIEEFNKAANSSRENQRIDQTAQAKALLAAVEDRSAEVGEVLVEEQRSARVGIIGAPNAGKSTLLNFLVGTKVSAVSRKTNTTRNEILGILTENDTQILFYDTPGLMMRWKGQPIRRDVKNRVQSAWMVTGHCDILIVLVDALRQIERPDQRVTKLMEKLGEKKDPKQKRILCLNKVDLVRQKRELVPLAQQFGVLPAYDRVFMISGLRGSGVRHLKEYLVEEAVLRPWEEQKGVVTDMSPVSIAKEVVWEHVLDNVHQEIPYHLHHKHISWKILKDRSIRIEQQLIVPTESQKKILVGKNGALIRKIGMAANDELSTRFGNKVHLILDVKLVSTDHIYAAVENIPEEMWL